MSEILINYWIVGSFHRVQDMYTRDRSTPITDEFYEGSDELAGAAGLQVDGVTTIAFRKKIKSENKCKNKKNCHGVVVVFCDYLEACKI